MQNGPAPLKGKMKANTKETPPTSRKYFLYPGMQKLSCGFYALWTVLMKTIRHAIALLEIIPVATLEKDSEMNIKLPLKQ